MIPGLNHNVRYRELVFHVQTEDSGMLRCQLSTHLFHEGSVIAHAVTSYERDAGQIADDTERGAAVKKKMQEQHKSLLKKLISGKLDDILVRNGIVPPLDAATIANPPAEAPPPHVSTPPAAAAKASTPPAAKAASIAPAAMASVPPAPVAAVSLAPAAVSEHAPTDVTAPAAESQIPVTAARILEAEPEIEIDLADDADIIPVYETRPSRTPSMVPIATIRSGPPAPATGSSTPSKYPSVPVSVSSEGMPSTRPRVASLAPVSLPSPPPERVSGPPVSLAPGDVSLIESTPAPSPEIVEIPQAESFAGVPVKSIPAPRRVSTVPPMPPPPGPPSPLPAKMPHSLGPPEMIGPAQWFNAPASLAPRIAPPPVASPPPSLSAPPAPAPLRPTPPPGSSPGTPSTSPLSPRTPVPPLVPASTISSRFGPSAPAASVPATSLSPRTPAAPIVPSTTGSGSVRNPVAPIVAGASPNSASPTTGRSVRASPGGGGFTTPNTPASGPIAPPAGLFAPPPIAPPGAFEHDGITPITTSSSRASLTGPGEAPSEAPRRRAVLRPQTRPPTSVSSPPPDAASSPTLTSLRASSTDVRAAAHGEMTSMAPQRPTEPAGPPTPRGLVAPPRAAPLPDAGSDAHGANREGAPYSYGRTIAELPAMAQPLDPSSRRTSAPPPPGRRLAPPDARTDRGFDPRNQDPDTAETSIDMPAVPRELLEAARAEQRALKNQRDKARTGLVSDLDLQSRKPLVAPSRVASALTDPRGSGSGRPLSPVQADWNGTNRDSIDTEYDTGSGILDRSPGEDDSVLAGAAWLEPEFGLGSPRPAPTAPSVDPRDPRRSGMAPPSAWSSSGSVSPYSSSRPGVIDPSKTLPMGSVPIPLVPAEPHTVTTPPSPPSQQNLLRQSQAGVRSSGTQPNPLSVSGTRPNPARNSLDGGPIKRVDDASLDDIIQGYLDPKKRR